MQFTFETTIKETKGALNTCAKIAEILNNAEITFGTAKNSQMPGIWAKLDDSDKKVWIAEMIGDEAKQIDYHMTSQQRGNWWHAAAQRRQRDTSESVVFEHLTDAAEKMVKAWIQELCEEYESRMNSDE